jgi:serine phosphatase RsbU (regulator of sigma subunit)
LFFGTSYNDTLHRAITLKQSDFLKKVLKYKQNNITFHYSAPYYPNDDITFSYFLEGYEREWSNWVTKTDKDYTNLDEGHYTFKIKAQNMYGIESEIAEYEFSILPPWYKTIWALLLYILAALGVIAITVKLYTRKLRLEKIRLEQIVKERTEEVVKQKDEILQQRDEIAEKNKSITDSIEYAKRIQNAVLPSKEFAQEVLPEHFILFRPRDIVSGDFYWFTKKDNLLILIAADCTGHGVPGAFMSMLGVSFINEIVNKHEVKQAGDILTHLRADVKRTLSQTGKEGEAKDGMDIALCVVDLENMKLQYAGAYNPMYMFRNNELIEFKADRMPIGIYVKEKDTFTNNEIDLEKGDVFYIFSDGYQDQFGGDDGQKFKTKNFKEFLQQIHHKPMAEQRELLNTNIDKWRGKWEQVDDIIVFGVRIP